MSKELTFDEAIIKSQQLSEQTISGIVGRFDKQMGFSHSFLGIECLATQLLCVSTNRAFMMMDVPREQIVQIILTRVKQSIESALDVVEEELKRKKEKAN